MKAVIQRVEKASVGIKGDQALRSVGRGLVVLIGVGSGDTVDDARYLADKISVLRLFEDKNGKMNLSLKDIGGEVLVISQFTLYADCTRGRRPDFTKAADSGIAEKLYDEFIKRLEQGSCKVKNGWFGAHMRVEIINDGPVTCILDTKR